MQNNVVLIGYMGCGKSSVGEELAKIKGMKFLDLDDYIEEKEKKSIKDLFQDKGEVYFRKVETMYLNECLEQFTNTILSLGGGTPCFGQNMEYILNSKKATSIYLQTSIGELSERLFSQRNKRPLIAHTQNKEELSEFIAKHVFERLNFYSRAEHTVYTDNKTLFEVTKEIEGLLA